jgi:L-ascorbate metabolism protein UlaG (beta-lactamase superfamily)
VALLPIWGWGPRLGGGHLDPRRAAEALALLHPRIAVPIHWGVLYPLGVGWLKPRYLTEPARRFSELASELAPEVDVRVLAPGESLVVAPAS